MMSSRSSDARAGLSRDPRAAKRSGWIIVPRVDQVSLSPRSEGAFRSSGILPVYLQLSLGDRAVTHRDLVVGLQDAVTKLRGAEAPAPIGLFGTGVVGEAVLEAAGGVSQALAALVGRGVRYEVVRPYLDEIAIPILLEAPVGVIGGFPGHVEVRERISDRFLVDWLGERFQDAGFEWHELRPDRGRRLLRRLFPATLLATSSLAVTAPPSVAAVTATFVKGTLTITGDEANDTITLTRASSGDLLLNGAKIKGSPTVMNVDSVNLGGGGGDDTITINLQGGQLAPGASKETSTPEIEVVLDGGGGDVNTFKLIGTKLNDRIDMGPNGFNLNGDDDVDKTGGGFSIIYFDGGLGNDVLNGNGTPEVGGKFPFGLFLVGSKGNDRLLGGTAENLLVGGPGGDKLVGSKAFDGILGGPGKDFLTGSGDDDDLDGGPDKDTLVEKGNINFVLSDTKFVGPGTDKIAGLEIARLTGGDSNNLINGVKFAGVLVASGLGGNDTIRGGPAGDKMSGGIGKDSLYGNKGNDILNGGKSFDFGSGGPGDNKFISIEKMGP